MNEVDIQKVTLRDGRKVVLRDAIPQDAEAVLRFMNISLPEQQPYILTMPEEFNYTLDEERQVIRETRERGGTILLALVGDEVIGTLTARLQPRRRVAHVAKMGMSIRIAYQDVGLGSAMMLRLIDWAESNPVMELIELSVFMDNLRALALYRKFGFQEAGHVPRRTKFGPGVYKDDIIMYRFVDGSVRDE